MNRMEQILDVVTGWTGSKWTNPMIDQALYVGPIFHQSYPSGTLDWCIFIHVGYSKYDNYPAQVAIKHHRGQPENRLDVTSEPRRCPHTGKQLKPTDSLRASAKKFAERVNKKFSEEG